MTLTILDAIDRERLDEARDLIREYQVALGVDLCFQNFDAEINDLAKFYGPPGRLFLAVDEDNAAIGCAGFHEVSVGKPQPRGEAQFDDIGHDNGGRALDAIRSNAVAEIKRLYVRPSQRKSGAGRALVDAVIDTARDEGFQYICLDTLNSLTDAIRMYERYGFIDIEPYYDNPLGDVRFMALKIV